MLIDAARILEMSGVQISCAHAVFTSQQVMLTRQFPPVPPGPMRCLRSPPRQCLLPSTLQTGWGRSKRCCCALMQLKSAPALLGKSPTRTAARMRNYGGIINLL